jgi:hypothetical protein
MRKDCKGSGAKISKIQVQSASRAFSSAFFPCVHRSSLPSEYHLLITGIETTAMTHIFKVGSIIDRELEKARSSRIAF